MSAIKHHHHDLIERQIRYYNPEAIADLEAAIEAKIKRGTELAAALYDTHRQRLAGRTPNPPAWHLRQQLVELEESIELDLSALRRI